MNSYGILMAASLFVGLAVALSSAKRLGVGLDLTFRRYALVAFCCTFGAQAAGYFAEWKLRESPGLPWATEGTGASWGALLAGFAVAGVMLRRRGAGERKAFAALLTSVPFIQAIARIGCASVGCCHGRPSGEFPGVVYAQTTGLPTELLHQSLFPTQFMESFGCLLIGVAIFRALPRLDWSGVVIRYVVSYSVLRFSLEFFRGDSQRGDFFGGALSTAQLIAIGSLAAVGLWWWCRSAFEPKSR